MTRSAVKIVALAALCAGLLMTPLQLSAAGRRGAELTVTRVDGSRVSGELIAVRPGSLLLLTREGGEASIDLPAIGSVRIHRKSHLGLFAGAGLGAGAVTGFVLGWRFEDDAPYRLRVAARGGLILGLAGAALGALVGGLHGIDSSFSVAGRPSEEIASQWERLGRVSREGRLTGAARPIPAAPAAAPAPALTPHETPSRGGKRPRLRLSVGGAKGGPTDLYRQAAGSFRFPGEASPETGPFGVEFLQTREYPEARRHTRLTHASLSLELNPRLAVEAEFFDLGNDSTDGEGRLALVSALDGRRYAGWASAHVSARFSGLLCGIAIRPFGSSPFRRNIVEFGAAVGPALARGRSFLWPREDVAATEDFHKTLLSARIRAAYDFYPVPSLSLGAFVDWRFAQTRLAASSSAGDTYFVTADAPRASFWRITEVSFPALPVSRTGFYWGLRLGVRI